MRFDVGQHKLDLKIVQSHVYLGAVIGYRKTGTDTVRHHMSLAAGQFSRLRPILRSHAVPLRLRLRLWQACLPACLLHGLDCTGLLESEVRQVHSLTVHQARLVANSHSMLTRETNADFMHRLCLPDPIRRLHQAILNRQSLDAYLGPLLYPSEAQLQWRAVLLSQMAMAERANPDQGPARVIPVDRILEERFECPECSQQFSAAAALKRHRYKQHFAEDERQDRQLEVKQHARSSHMEHAQDGLPWCKHCQKKFNNWPNFHYHINSRSCPTLRTIYQSVQPGSTLAVLSDALVDKPDIVELAGHCDWLTLAAHPEVKRRIHHCVECFHRSVRPQYVKRHMLAKHPDLKPQIERCVQFVQRSNLGIVSPCRYCGECFQRKDAHLRSCVALFNGAFLFTRLARDRPLGGTHHDPPAARAGCTGGQSPKAPRGYGEAAHDGGARTQGPHQHPFLSQEAHRT